MPPNLAVDRRRQIERLSDDAAHRDLEISRKSQKTDVLVNNVGGVFGDRNRTIDGFEKTIQVNYLATFLLTTSLWPSRRPLAATASGEVHGHIRISFRLAVPGAKC